MRRFFTLAAIGAVALLVASRASAEEETAPATVATADTNELEAWNQRRLQHNTLGMQVLAGWAVTNMATGVAGWAASEDERWQNFHLMNAGWNVVNLALAGFGWWDAATTDPGSLDERASFEAVDSLEKLLLLNVGLDVAYVTAGAALWWNGEETGASERVGWGQSLVVQGAFLFGFDLVLWGVQRALKYDLLGGYWER